MGAKESLRETIRSAPDVPGVYVLRNAKGEVIYVGKAKSLKERLRAYVQEPDSSDLKGQALREELDSVEVSVCGDEVEALIVEAELIKKHRPRYNVLLRDDKSYPYIAVTLPESYPRAILARGRKVRGYRYYGPYVNAKAARKTLLSLQKVFPLRQCKGKTPGERSRHPCLYLEMGMCLGPCTGKVGREAYMDVVRSFCGFLEGRQTGYLKRLEAEMLDASRLLEFEKAARIRNQIKAAERVLAHRGKQFRESDEHDTIAFSRDLAEAAFVVARYRQGIRVGNFWMSSELLDDIGDAELLTEFLKRYYSEADSIPPLIVVPVAPVDSSLASWLRRLRGAAVEIRVPKRGDKRDELAVALENARVAFEKRKLERAADRARIDRAMRELSDYLSLSRFPLRIECYDVSTLYGNASVGSMVVFQDGTPERSSYRKFGIKYTPGMDDVGMMREILRRRFSKLKEAADGSRASRNDRHDSFSRKPDLVIVDGGRAQLGAAVKVLGELDVREVDVAALAKRFEEIYRPGSKTPIVIPRGSEALFLLQRIRDEAHRFAVTYHRRIMEAGSSVSWLDFVSGVGLRRKKKLIEHFGSPKAVSEASLDELMGVPGMTRPVAQAIFMAARKLG